MRVRGAYGSKERLFEMLQRVNGTVLTEAVLPKEKKEEMINKFVQYAQQELKLGDELPKIILSYDEKEAETMKSFGLNTPNKNEIRVVVVNRNLADVLRTLAHELVHFKQFKEGKLTPDSNKTGSEHENEANALAGVLLRNFGRENSIIFE